jgi:hypothetical protein
MVTTRANSPSQRLQGSRKQASTDQLHLQQCALYCRCRSASMNAVFTMVVSSGRGHGPHSKGGWHTP